MTTNIYDTANQLEREIRELEQFKALEKAFNTLKADEAVFGVFAEFQELQQGLQQKMQMGEEVTEEEITRAQEMTAQFQEEALITELMTAEQAFSIVLNDLNRIITTPLQELYGGK